MGRLQGRAARQLPSWSGLHKGRNALCSRRSRLHEVVWGHGGRNALQVDGCWENEVSRECLTDDTVCWLWMGSMPKKSHGRGDTTGARSGSPCQAVWYYHAQLAFGLIGKAHSLIFWVVPFGLLGFLSTLGAVHQRFHSSHSAESSFQSLSKTALTCFQKARFFVPLYDGPMRSPKAFDLSSAPT